MSSFHDDGDGGYWLSSCHHDGVFGYESHFCHRDGDGGYGLSSCHHDGDGGDRDLYPAWGLLLLQQKVSQHLRLLEAQWSQRNRHTQPAPAQWSLTETREG